MYACARARVSACVPCSDILLFMAISIKYGGHHLENRNAVRRMYFYFCQWGGCMVGGVDESWVGYYM